MHELAWFVTNLRKLTYFDFFSKIWSQQFWRWFMHKLTWRRLHNCGQTIVDLLTLAAHAPCCTPRSLCICTRLLLKHNNAWVTFFEGLHLHNLRPILEYNSNVWNPSHYGDWKLFYVQLWRRSERLNSICLLHVNKDFLTDVLNITNLLNELFCANDKRKLFFGSLEAAGGLSKP